MSEPAPGEGSSPVPEPRRKRIKIDIACDTCRARKVRCDGARPACSTCARKLSLRDKCTYSGAGQNEKKDQGSHASASSGIFLDSQIDTHAGNHATRRPSMAPPPPDTAAPTHGPQWPTAQHISPPVLGYSPAAPTPASTARSGHSDDRRTVQPDTSPSAIDSMTAVADEGASTLEYFGSSSAGSFTRQLKAAIDARLGVSHAASPRPPAPTAPDHHPAAKPYDDDDGDLASAATYLLPTRRVADRLLAMYWQYVDPLYPFLDRAAFTRSYEALFTGTPLHPADERLFVAALNVLFALSTQLHEAARCDGGRREDSSGAYFARARELLRLVDQRSWDAGAGGSTNSVELVQCLLLMGQYLQSTNCPHRTWMVVGSAIRIAQGLGLHLPEASEAGAVGGVEERETRRRVWYGCILMDRTVCMTHGRPAMIADNILSTVPAPKWSRAKSRVDSNISDYAHFAFFVKSVELYEIIHRAISRMYSGPEARPCGRKDVGHGVRSEAEDEDLAAVMQIDSSLSRWKCGLPEHLKPDAPELPDSAIFQRQTVVLRIRFLHARILLLRPILARFSLEHHPSQNPSHDSLKTRMTEQCALFCVETAKRIIATLAAHHQHQDGDGVPGLLPAWWYRVYYVYSAATILLAARLRPDVFSQAEVGRAWAQAMDVLEGHVRFGQSARRCRAALQILSGKILQQQQQQGGDGSQRPAGEVPPAMAAADPVVEEDGFSFAEPDLAGISFDVNDFTWLNDMHAWELLNQA